MSIPVTDTLNKGDYADKSSAETDFHVQIALANQRAKQQETLPSTGHCHFCGETVQNSARFCDEFCREDHEKLRRRQGFAA